MTRELKKKIAEQAAKGSPKEKQPGTGVPRILLPLSVRPLGTSVQPRLEPAYRITKLSATEVT